MTVADVGDEVLVERDGSVAWVRLNRPDRLNAMNAALMDGLVLRLRELADDPEVRCVALTGQGRAFCAGGDVDLMSDRERRGSPTDAVGPRMDHQVRVLDRRFEAIELLSSMPKPTVAMVRGWALGGGLALALACDVRFVAEDARLGMGFLARAVSGTFGMAYLLTSILGSAKAREFALLREWVGGADAVAMGLATSVHPADELEEHTQEVCRRLAAGPTFAYGKFKDSVNFALGADLRRVMHYEAVNSRLTSLSDDARESVAAYREKRPPRFTGT
ncbi:Enoyl-CoA hydratase [Pseudonocardia thermophila]|uniref:Enoyl-CoA hydratase n=1 Tax=Pseudonocardia thermophila TaxID=1848 RepID=A0A1M6XNR7_PSETH|nr:Enoyl-CoA hydratase [Pseudonocardia thermophila]